MASVTPKFTPQPSKPAPSSPDMLPKGRPWIETLSNTLPECTEEIEFIVECIGESALKNLAKHFDEQQAVSIALALALLHDSNPHLGKIILGQKNYIKQFGDFVITSGSQGIEEFLEAGNIASNLHALVMKTLSPQAEQRAKHDLTLSHLLLDALPHKVDIVQFISNALPREVVQVTNEPTENTPQCLYYNPSLNLGTLKSEQRSKIVIIEEDLLKTVPITPNNQTIVIPVTKLSLENLAALKATVFNKIAAFDGRSLVEEKIALPEDRAKQVKDSWKKLSVEHQKTFLNYLERLLRDGSCGTMKRLVSKPSEFISVRILTPGGPRLYLVEGRGEFQGQYMIVGIGNKDSQAADLKALDTIQLDGLFTRPRRSSADIFGE